VESAEFALRGTRRRVKVTPFLMARYPVTVTEYERFVDSDSLGEISRPEQWEISFVIPTAPSQEYRVLRGSGWVSPPGHLRASPPSLHVATPGARSREFGFRCTQDLPLLVLARE
jgi:formylglycine-generating enzyme required for sulfatase activity